uniref:sel1 repeat family protein n=1 Tax=Eikenella halliae TaxID=1795832 RepID=UPI0028D8F84C
LAEQLTDEQNSIQEQIYAQSWLGRCYFEQAKQAEGKEAAKLFERAVEHHQQQLRLAEQLEDKQNNLQEQINAQAWLGRCYFEQAMKAKGKESEQLFEQAVKHRQQQLRLAEQLADKQNSLQEQNNAQSWLGRCYFKQAIIQKKWERYFEWKKQKIQGDLFETKKGDLINAITTILAVLNIPPMELGSTPLAHYTSPSVCERLFGIVSDETNDKTNDNYPVDNNKVSPMRIGSSTYMNDPTEGEGLLELLNLQDLKLENKADCPVHNAFFTCFSSRVNDLNQFRLYGKENSVEASGCCLVFNKSGDWLKEPDVSASFKSFTNKQNEGFKEPIEADVTGSKDENLPLYQVAYIAYYDEYIAKEKCGKWLLNKNNQSFGIRLKPIGKNPSWHQFRIKKLEEALIGLIEKSNNISDENSKALEYIRYLFKDFAFRDEEEFRLLKIEQIGSDKIEYCPTTKSVYLPYADIRDIVDEVILGTNYEKSGNNRKAEVFQHLMRKHYPNVKVSRSSLPINANLPIRKE